MARITYVWDNIAQGARELEVLLNDGYEVVTSTLYESNEELVFAAVLVKEEY